MLEQGIPLTIIWKLPIEMSRMLQCHGVRDLW